MNTQLVVKETLDNEIVKHSMYKDVLEAWRNEGIMSTLFPELFDIIGFGDGKEHKDLWLHTKQVVAQAAPVPSQRWTALFHDIGKPRTIRRLKGEVSFHGHEAVSSDMFWKIIERSKLWDENMGEAREIAWLIGHSGRIDCKNVREWTDSAVRRLITDCGPRLPALIRFVRADVTTKNEARYQRHLQKLDELIKRVEEVKKIDEDRNVLPKGLGTAVLSMHPDRNPGKWLGNIIDGVRTRVLSGELERDRDVGYYLERL